MKIQITKLPKNRYDIGGVLQSHGADWGDGLVHINAGSSHELNPNDGVQMGVDPQGTPNLVEEGETIYDDYVFSNRIEADANTLKRFELNPKTKKTYAELSKWLEHKMEVDEKPNDPIAQAGFKQEIAALAEEQERQKQEMEAQKAQEAFNALSPEEQVAVMNAAQEQEAAEAQAQEQAIAEQQAMQQPSPEEIAAQQQMMEQEDQAALEQQQLAQMQANVSALGGELVKSSDVNSDANIFAPGGKKARGFTKKYSKEWFINQAKALGLIGDDDDDIEGFKFVDDDPSANLLSFNTLYKNYQREQALDKYIRGQRQSKKNELFGPNGLYSYSDDRSKIYKNRVNDVDRLGWINSDYTGALDDEGNLIGYLSQEDYDKLTPNQKETYRRISEKAGDRMYDYRGNLIKDLYDGTEDDILNAYTYDDDFEWNPRDAQTLQYPAESYSSALSNLRYAPIFGHVLGLVEGAQGPDYSRAEAVQNLGNYVPKQVSGAYNPTYLTYRPMDIWSGLNVLNANARATDRAIMNSNSPSRYAGLVANAYNTINAQGELFRQGLDYNRAQEQAVAQHNSAQNQIAASLLSQAERSNQQADLQAVYNNARYKSLGYQMMDEIDARRADARNANWTGLLGSLQNVGEEAYDKDTLEWLVNSGVLKGNRLSANGGKIKRRR